jgi:transposase
MSTTYKLEFKKQIVGLHNSGKPLSDIVREYGIPLSTVRDWVKRFNKCGSLVFTDTLSDEQKNARAMEKELKRLKMENEILKHAALILGRKDS